MFSLVIPIYNEEKLIEELVKRTVSATESFTKDYEVIFVDDGSTDDSANAILSFREDNKRIKLLSLSKNFGHQAAYTAGLEHTKGDIVAMMDGDLQDPPELLPVMFNKITGGGFDIINAKRTGRRGLKSRDLYATLFHAVFRNIGDISAMGDSGNYSVMKREAVNALLEMKEKVRYLPGMRSYIGFRHGEVEYVREERYRGKPKMTFRKLFTLASDAIFSFSRFPIRFCLIIGAIGTFVFLGAGIYVLIAKATGTAVPGWSSILLSIYFLGSVQLVFLGVLGEYIFRNYKESQNRPVYFIRKFYDDIPGQ